MKIATSAYPLDFHQTWADYAAKIETWVADAAGQGAEALEALALDVHGVGTHAQDRGHARAHGRAVGGDAGALGGDHHVGVDHPPARRLDQLAGGGEQRGAVGVLPARVAVGEEASEIVQARRAEERVRQGVQHRVAVRVPLGARGVGQLDAAEDAAAARDQAVQVEARTDPQIARPSAHRGSPARSRSSAPATDRSAGVVTLRLAMLPRTIVTGPT